MPIVSYGPRAKMTSAPPVVVKGMSPQMKQKKSQISKKRNFGN